MSITFKSILNNSDEIVEYLQAGTEEISIEPGKYLRDEELPGQVFPDSFNINSVSIVRLEEESILANGHHVELFHINKKEWEAPLGEMHGVGGIVIIGVVDTGGDTLTGK